jgi:hypothetical protein
VESHYEKPTPKRSRPFHSSEVAGDTDTNRKPARDSSGPASTIPETLAVAVLFLPNRRGNGGHSNDGFPLAITGLRTTVRSPESPGVSV